MEPARFRTSRRDLLRLGASAALASCLGPALARAGVAEAQAEAGTIPRVLSAEYRHGLDELTRGTASGLELRATTAGRLGLTSATSSGGSLMSRPVRLDFPVTHVGLHWVATGEPDRVALQVRTSGDGEPWQPWQPVGVDAHGGPGPGGARCGTLASADRARWVEYRVDLGGGAALESVTVVGLNAVDGPPLAERVGAQLAGAPPGRVVTREQWGADESIRFENGQETWPRAYVPFKHVFVHHTATTNGYADAAGEVRAIYVYHAKHNGWGDIGYNLLVGADGRVYEGRRGREGRQYGPPYYREILSNDVVGAQVLRFNYGSAGMALIGNFNDLELPETMAEPLVEQIERVCRLRGIDPTSAADFLSSSRTWHRALGNLSGHRDAFPTECPGERAYRRLPELRARVAERIGRGARSHVFFTRAPGDTAGTSATVGWADLSDRAALVTPGFKYYLEGWRRRGANETGEDVEYLSGLTPDGVPVWSGPERVTAKAFEGLPRGNYTLHVRAVDGEGNESSYEARTTFRAAE